MNKRLKVCSKCKTLKPISEFNKNKQTKDGLCVWCRVCNNRHRKEHYMRTREFSAQYRKEYYEKHKDKIKNDKKQERIDIRDKVLSHYGNVCACCGEKIRTFLSIDHIDGGGYRHRKTVPANYLYKWLIKNNFPDGFQLLCRNCNWGKHIYGACPHTEEVFEDDTRFN
jgi:predicted restriction endonuclease